MQATKKTSVIIIMMEKLGLDVPLNTLPRITVSVFRELYNYYYPNESAVEPFRLARTDFASSMECMKQVNLVDRTQNSA